MLERLKSVLPAYAQAYSVRWGMSQTPNDKGKREAKYKAFRNAPTDALFFEHFSGKAALNMQPLLDHVDFPGEVCQWGAIDIDAYGQPDIAMHVKDQLARMGIRCYAEVSKSGGAHIYIILASPTKASQFRQGLEKIASWLALPKDATEFRPAQNSVDFAGGDLGHFMVLPGFGQPLEEVVPALESAVMTIQEFNAIMDEGELSDGPACLYPLLMQGKASGWKNRNLFTYQLAVFFKLKYPADFDQRVKLFLEKHMADDPLPDKEIETVCQSVGKNAKAFFRCKGIPFEPVCNKSACMRRKNGIGARMDVVSLFVDEPPTQLDTDPPIWFITIGNPATKETKRIKLATQQLFRASEFKRRCMEELRFIPQLPKQEEWEALLTKKLSTAHIIPVPFEMTEAARVLDAMYRFVLSAAKTTEAEKMLRGRVLAIPTDTGVTASFRPVDFANFLDRSKIRGVSSADLFAVLSELQGLGKARQETLSIPPLELEVYTVDIDSKYMQIQAEMA